MSRFGFSIVISIAMLVLFQASALSQSAYSVFPDSMLGFRLAAEWSNIVYFYCAVIYFCSALALLTGRYFKPGLLNFGISILSGALMVFEPNVLTMIVFTGYQYTVKVTILVAFITIFCLISLALLFLPTVLAFANKYDSKLSTVFFNFGGIIIPPLIIFALYRVQSWMVQERKKVISGGERDEIGIADGGGAVGAVAPVDVAGGADSASESSREQDSKTDES